MHRIPELCVDVVSVPWFLFCYFLRYDSCYSSGHGEFEYVIESSASLADLEF